MQEVAGLLIYCFLKKLLCDRLRGQVADAPGRDVVFRKRIGKSLSDFGGFRNLGGCRWSSGVSVDTVNSTQLLERS